MSDGPAHVGVDGCKAGWIAVTLRAEAPPSVSVNASFAALLAKAGEEAFIAVDMPIGLPDFIPGGGRGPEQAVRKLLSKRRSSVFSIASRKAVYCEQQENMTWEETKAARHRAQVIAKQTSENASGIAFQAFCLFPKIRQLDIAMLPKLQSRIRETHPELAFCVLNGGVEMHYPKKSPAGMAERRDLLARHGYDPAFLAQRPPPGAAADDFLDACACALVAGRVARNEAVSFPPVPATDAKGLQIAIWA